MDTELRHDEGTDDRAQLGCVDTLIPACTGYAIQFQIHHLLENSSSVRTAVRTFVVPRVPLSLSCPHDLRTLDSTDYSFTPLLFQRRMPFLDKSCQCFSRLTQRSPRSSAWQQLYSNLGHYIASKPYFQVSTKMRMRPPGGLTEISDST
jgi:hypothetical protein